MHWRLAKYAIVMMVSIRSQRLGWEMPSLKSATTNEETVSIRSQRLGWEMQVVGWCYIESEKFQSAPSG